MQVPMISSLVGGHAEVARVDAGPVQRLGLPVAKIRVGRSSHSPKASSMTVNTARASAGSNGRTAYRAGASAGGQGGVVGQPEDPGRVVEAIAAGGQPVGGPVSVRGDEL